LLPTTRPETHQNLIHTDKEQHAQPGQTSAQPDSNTHRTIPPDRLLSVPKAMAPNPFLLCDDISVRAHLNTPSSHRQMNRRPRRTGGGERVRTDDPLLAKQVLSQLSYTPTSSHQPKTMGQAEKALVGGPGRI
jgi:hypothetical protein